MRKEYAAETGDITGRRKTDDWRMRRGKRYGGESTRKRERVRRSDSVFWSAENLETVRLDHKRGKRDDDPKSVNFLGVRKLAFAAKESGCERFVRVTGMSVGYSAFDFIAVLLNNVLSMTIKFQLLGELAIETRASQNDETKNRMSYTIVRPGNLTDQEGIDANDQNSTNNSNSDGSTTTKTVKKNNENVVVLTHGTNHASTPLKSVEKMSRVSFTSRCKTEKQRKT